MSNVTKKLFLKSIKCFTLGWLTNSEPSQPVESVSAMFRIEEGLEIHNRSRNIFKGGSLVQGDNVSSAEQTIRLLRDENISVIFEATFLVDGYIAKADILKREPSGWHIFEVKSGINDKKEYVDDLAYTAMVAEHTNLQIAGCSLMLLSKDYRLGIDDEKLFVKVDHTEDVLKQAKEFEGFWDKIPKVIFQSSKPAPILKWECKGCVIFKECIGKDTKNHIFDLPRLSQKKFLQLIDSNIINIEDIPNDFQLTPNQAKVNDSVKAGQPIIDKEGLRDALESIVFPAYNLDFETVQTAIPLYSDIAPYAQIPTQYSLHICSGPGQVSNHFEYLADPLRDCRRELAEKLLSDCGNQGSIIVYTSFEKNRIKGLVDICPDLKSDLLVLIDRIVDINKMISENYYHPEFQGSFSIKRILPVLVRDLKYEDMDVSNGLDASATFAYLVKGKYDDEEAKEKRKQLLEYCKLDTLAMVKLEEKLREYI